MRQDPTIAKIAYYAVKEDGDFRSLYSFDNPHAAKARERRSAMDEPDTPRRVATRQRSLFKQIRALFEED